MTARAAPPGARTIVALLAARAVFGLVYLGVNLGGWPVPWYFPLDHRWEITARPAGFAMGWFGATGAALIASAIAAALAWIAAARGPLARALGRTAIVIALARAGGMVLFVDFAYFGWTLTHQSAGRIPACEGP